MPHDASALVTYISAEQAFRGIGPARAKALHNEYGDKLYTALLECQVGVVRMIGEENAIIAAAAMRERRAELNIINTLDELDLYKIVGPHKAIHLARAWGEVGAQAIRDNPYCLLPLAGWTNVDKLAAHLGIDDYDPRRVSAAIEHVLTGVLGANDTMITSTGARSAAQQLLSFSVSDAAIEACVASGGALKLADRLQPFGAGQMEVECAVILNDLAQQTPVVDLGIIPATDAEVELEIENYERGRTFRLTNVQRRAVKAAHVHRFFCLSGYAGSGKTTVLRAICDTVEAFGRSPIIMALSGRAAQRAAESTDREAITIAKFLAMNDQENSEALGADRVVIVDEASMCSLPDIWRILKRLGEAQLILCGDPAQLPPISFGLVFHVLADASAIPVVTLDRVMRQREESGIPAVAEAVRSGLVAQLPMYSGAKPGVTFNECSETNTIGLITRIGMDLRKSGVDPDDVQIIGSIQAGKAGVSAINDYYHQRVVKRGAELWPGFKHIASGEPLIWTKNDKKTGFVNGSMGRVTGFEDRMVQATIDSEDVNLDPYTSGQMTELAYAITVHKSQGSQWPIVIIPVFKNRLMDRSMIYTAITRAQEQVILVGDRSALEEAISTTPAAMKRKVGFPTWLHLAHENLRVEHSS